MRRYTVVAVILTWLCLLTVPVFAGLQARDCCVDCKKGFCPINKAPQHSCHSSKSDCQMKAGCDHSKDIVLFTFEGLLPDNGYSESLASDAFPPNRFQIPTVSGAEVESPPPKSLLS